MRPTAEQRDAATPPAGRGRAVLSPLSTDWLARSPAGAAAADSDEQVSKKFEPATTPGQWRAIPPFIRVMFCLDALMGVLYVVSKSMRHVLGRRVTDFINLNAESNLPSWYSAGQLMLIGALLVAFAVVQIRRGLREAWAVGVGGLGFLFLSLDESTGLHEQFGYWLDSTGRKATLLHETGMWMVICAPLFLIALAALGLAARKCLRGRGRIVRRFAVGAGVFVFAAAGVEAMTNFVSAIPALARAEVILEEVGEMAGATIMLWAAYELARSHGVRLLAIEEPRPSSPP
jgi:hypothetical protein